MRLNKTQIQMIRGRFKFLRDYIDILESEIESYALDLEDLADQLWDAEQANAIIQNWRHKSPDTYEWRL